MIPGALFKRTHASRANLMRANQIMADELVLMDYWPPYKLSGDLTWREDPYGNNSWQLYLHSLLHVSYLVNGYEMTGDVEYLRKARAHIQSWLNAHHRATPTDGTYAWTDHSTANRAVTLVHFLSCWRDTSDADELFASELTKALESHATLLLDPAFYARTNHGIMQDQALLAIATSLSSLPASVNWIETARQRLLARLDEDVTLSGVHKEHSPFYHYFVLSLFANTRSFLAARQLYQGEFDAKLNAMQGVLARTITPRKELPLIGDTPRMDMRQRLGIKAADARVQFVLTDGASGESPGPLDVVYSDAGLAIFRNAWTGPGNVHITFTAWNHSITHKHADDLSLCVSLDQTDYLVDCGFYNHDKKDARRQYLASAFAHNSVVVDDATYSITPHISGRVAVTDYRLTEDSASVTGAHTYYSGVTVTRTLEYRKPANLVIVDRLSSEVSHRYSQVFNIGEDVLIEQCDASGASLRSKLDGSRLRIFQRNCIDECTVHHGEREPLLGWRSNEFGEIHPLQLLMFRARGANLAFHTEIVLYPS